ncbi:Polyprenyl synthetase [Hydrogenobaculum sp. Y04AAS1]|uniref:polyprenyl synthetase family protein n=1 Tax=Hydrogenobaculum sp. (strain Y04AAS1) TaxID=380749 RepID=UPI00015BC65E|nr:Polyprenyl synthetase [Hydrogenobaculum sp. Y04AAS1]HCT66165.1 polyprenyl synthetase family protein [Hydrogenobaculum sp.]
MAQQSGLDSIRKRIELALSENLDSSVDTILKAGNSTIEAGGKRIRPLLLVYLVESLGGDVDKAIILGCGIEYIHIASLLHDDVVDKADSRRGKPSVNKVFGQEAAVLTGDYLYAKALFLYANYGNAKMIDILSKAVMNMAEGQLLELKSIGSIIDEKTYFDIIDGKTAYLIGACFGVGALISNYEEYEKFFDIGLKLGRAFQLIDDALDYEVDSQKLGKPSRNDLKEGKVTYPVISMLDKLDKELLKNILVSQNPSQEELDSIIDTVIEKGGVMRTKELAFRLLEEVKQELSYYPITEKLMELIEKTVKRDF